ncbi:hypothetical protein CEXT_801181 [Caerostris extrusa]|uniref:Uncharacterized protein n=1 Tax=Caerostris extrusa TaxID=172846 RepID=A0AAV4NFB6_CAEEX|nr:hypothetical protein CEXT_801181 [Caerostris extrusa]
MQLKRLNTAAINTLSSGTTNKINLLLQSQAGFVFIYSLRPSGKLFCNPYSGSPCCMVAALNHFFEVNLTAPSPFIFSQIWVKNEHDHAVLSLSHGPGPTPPCRMRWLLFLLLTFH